MGQLGIAPQISRVGDERTVWKVSVMIEATAGEPGA
jgi:hypothetical protein